MLPLHSHDCDCVPPAAKVEQRGAQTDCTESTCTPTKNTAAAWNSRLAAGRAASSTSAKKSASTFADRARSAVV